MRIGIDIDDVMADSLPRSLQAFNRRFGLKVPVTEARWEIFRRHPEIPADAIGAFFEELYRADFLGSRPLVPGALEGIGPSRSGGWRREGFPTSLTRSRTGTGWTRHSTSAGPPRGSSSTCCWRMSTRSRSRRQGCAIVSCSLTNHGIRAPCRRESCASIHGLTSFPLSLPGPAPTTTHAENLLP